MAEDWAHQSMQKEARVLCLLITSRHLHVTVDIETAFLYILQKFKYKNIFQGKTKKENIFNEVVFSTFVKYFILL